MSFKTDNKLELAGYQEIILPMLIKGKFHPLFIHYGNDEIANELQRRDIDMLVNMGNETRSVSLKVVTSLYDNIFCETISNVNTGLQGWLHYSAATEMYYLMREGKQYRLLIFYLSTLREIFIKNETLYPVAYGENKSYKTRGVLIPISDFGTDLYDTGILVEEHEPNRKI